MSARNLLVAALALLTALYALWFAHDRHVATALVVFALPPALLALGVWRGARTAGFWAGVLALGWFSHAIMVAWTRPAERGFACVAIALAVAIVFAASLPGLRARAARKRAEKRTE
jgi:uncharacterized membrane protein